MGVLVGEGAEMTYRAVLSDPAQARPVEIFGGDDLGHLRTFSRWMLSGMSSLAAAEFFNSRGCKVDRATALPIPRRVGRPKAMAKEVGK